MGMAREYDRLREQGYMCQEMEEDLALLWEAPKSVPPDVLDRYQAERGILARACHALAKSAFHPPLKINDG